MDQQEKLSPVSFFCPKCGQKVVGWKEVEKDAIREECPRCKAVLISKYRKAKRETLIRAVVQKNK